MVLPKSDAPYRELTKDNGITVLEEIFAQIQQQQRMAVEGAEDESQIPMKPVIRINPRGETWLREMIKRFYVLVSGPTDKLQQAANPFYVGALHGIPMYTYPHVPPDEIHVISFGPKKFWRFKIIDLEEECKDSTGPQSS